MSQKYLHSYTEKEQNRLEFQAALLEDFLFNDIDLSNVKKLLEVGCGIGSQSEILLKRFPMLHITGIDIAPEQIETAHTKLSKNADLYERVEFHCVNAENNSFTSNTFDSAFLCWVLEHVANPLQILIETHRSLTKGSIIYITEVQNSSFYLNKDCPAIKHYWKLYNEYQYKIGGNPNIGAELGVLLHDAGFNEIQLKSKLLHHDKRNYEGFAFMMNYMETLMLSASEELIRLNIIEENDIVSMQKEINQIKSEEDAVFFYTVIRASAMKI